MIPARKAMELWRMYEKGAHKREPADIVKFYRQAIMELQEGTAEQRREAYDAELVVPHIQIRCSQGHHHHVAPTESLSAWISAQWSVAQMPLFSVQGPVLQKYVVYTFGTALSPAYEFQQDVCPDDVKCPKQQDPANAVLIDIDVMRSMVARLKAKVDEMMELAVLVEEDTDRRNHELRNRQLQSTLHYF